MIDKVQKWMQQEGLVQAGDLVIAGVSGGADSVCLLLVLLQLREKIDFSLRAVHIEHGIRGEESRADARFVEKLCADARVCCHTYAVAVPKYAKEQGMGLEEAARSLRYECFRKEAGSAAQEAFDKERRSIKVALAHHADDNAETVLFQMTRGSGVDGLCGMRPRRKLSEGVDLIRPLLCVTRREIEEYLEKECQPYRTDGTNLDTDYSRNLIRHEVMPKLVQLNRQAVLHLNQSAMLMQEVSDYLECQTREAAEAVLSRDADSWRISDALFLQYPPLIQKEVIHLALFRAAGSSKDMEQVHIESVRLLWQKQTGKRVSLPCGMQAKRSYDGILILRLQGEKPPEEEALFIAPETLFRAEQGETVVFEVSGNRIQLRIFDFNGEKQEIPKKKYTKWLNYDKIKHGLQIRRRRSGDYLIIDKEGHKKKLKEYFIEEKIPGEVRDTTWLLAEDSHVIWVVGGRISAGYKIEDNTRKMLEVQITGGNYHEDQED